MGNSNFDCFYNFEMLPIEANSQGYKPREFLLGKLVLRSKREKGRSFRLKHLQSVVSTNRLPMDLSLHTFETTPEHHRV